MFWGSTPVTKAIVVVVHKRDEQLPTNETHALNLVVLGQSYGVVKNDGFAIDHQGPLFVIKNRIGENAGNLYGNTLTKTKLFRGLACSRPVKLS